MTSPGFFVALCRVWSRRVRVAWFKTAYSGHRQADTQTSRQLCLRYVRVVAELLALVQPRAARCLLE